jgi:uncharacterized membrane protein (DUF106 family)
MDAWAGHALTLVLMMAALAGVYAAMKSQLAVLVSQLETLKEQMGEIKESQLEKFELEHRRNYDAWHEPTGVRSMPECK